MQENDLKKMYFSQLALSTYQQCELKFKKRYLDGLYWPADWGEDQEQKEIVEKGRLFHRLARRYYSQGEIIFNTQIDKDLKNWIKRLKTFRPFTEKDLFYPEHVLRLNKDNIKLLAKYDLLYIDSRSGKMIIYDWKTNKKRLKAEELKNSIQSKVYLYVLAKAGAQYSIENQIAPENIKIIYWNPRYPHDWFEFFYDRESLKRDEKDIREQIKLIQNKDFDNLKEKSEDRICRYCEYRPICQGKKAENIEPKDDEIKLDPVWEEVEEVQFTGEGL
ncbi:MAG: PD-(D/E)XK nuclease family protein [Halanaerobiales bacterium]